MVRLKFIGLFTLSHGGKATGINKEACPFEWPVALCSGLAVLSCGWGGTLKKSNT